MEFSRVIGKIDENLITRAEEKLSKIFLELGTRYDNTFVGTKIGGCPLIFSLLYPIKHIATLNIPAAGTNGTMFFWNPKFILKQSDIGLRIICAHEAWHALYMHPQRRGSRNPKLWNIAVDYIVNGAVMDDFKARKLDAHEYFTKYLGKYMGLKEFAEMLKDPFAKDKNLANAPAPSEEVVLPGPLEERDLTEQEIKELERRETSVRFYYADPNLEEEMKRPEAIYDYLYHLLPKCPKCGSLGVYQKPNKNKSKDKSKDKFKGDKGDKGDKQESKDKEDKGGKGHDHGDGQSCGCSGDQNGQGDQDGSGGQGTGNDQEGCGHCDQCGDGVDVFDLGGTVDEHMDTEESEEKIAKRVSEAIEASRRMAGHVPMGLEDELGLLTAPKINWKDIIRARLLRARSGNGRNDWTRLRTRPIFSGMLVPKRKNFFANFGVLLDTSGSMSNDDMAFGVSQLISLDERGEGWLVCADSNIYWDDAVKLRKFNTEELSQVKVKGRGGTIWAPFFDEYEQHLGKCDFLIIISDMYLMDNDVAEMKDPGVPVIWLCTSGANFTPPFGKNYELRSL